MIPDPIRSGNNIRFKCRDSGRDEKGDLTARAKIIKPLDKGMT